MKSRIALLLALGFSATPAFAGIYLEPYVGYSKGSEDIEVGQTTPTPLNIKHKGTTSQVLYGGRVGWSFLMLALGAEYMNGKISEDFKTTTDNNGTITTSKSTAKRDLKNIGAFAALNLPLIRAFATYFPTAELKNSDSKVTGTSMKFGLGTTILPFVSVNLEYITYKYDKAKITGADFPTFKHDATMYMLSVSLPLSF